MTVLEQLGTTLAKEMRKTVWANQHLGPELGTIGPSLSLIPDSLRTPIPKGSYLVNLSLTHADYLVSVTTHTHNGGSHGGHTGGDGTHSHTDGPHTHRVPEVFRNLQEGDRVLLIWCDNEPVVVAIVTES